MSVAHPLGTFAQLLFWIKGQPYTILTALLLTALALPFLRKVESQWDSVYLRAATHLQKGEDLFRLEDAYLYPPFMAWLAIPFTWLGRMGARLTWYAINVVCVVLLLRWSWRLSGGSALERESAGWKEHLILVLGLACAFRFTIDCLQNQQTDLLLAVLVVGGCRLLQQESAGSHRPAFAAVLCLGLAAGMKCTPLLFAPYLLWRGRWLGAIGIGAIALGANLLPNLASAPERGGWWLDEWVRRYLLHLGRADVHAGVWGSAALMNQSISGAAYRWFVTDWSWSSAGFEVWPRADAVAPLTLKLIVYGFQGLLVAAAAFVLGRPGRLAAEKRDRLPFEFSLVLLLMVLLSPMSSKPHFCTLLLPAFLLARRMVRDKDRVAGLCLTLAILAGVLATKDLAGPNLASLAMWLGGVSASAFFLLAGCGFALFHNRLDASRNASNLHSLEAAYERAA